MPLFKKEIIFRFLFRFIFQEYGEMLMRSLKTKLILFVSLLLSLSMVAVSVISYLHGSNTLKEQLKDEYYLKSREASLELDVFLQKQASIFESVTAIDNKYFGNHAIFMKHMNELMKKFPEYLLMSYTFDKDGKHVYIHNGKVIDASDLSYVKQVMTKKKAIVSDPIISKSTGKPCVVAVAPLFNSKGEAHGFLGGCIEFQKALEKVINAKFGETGFATLVDGQGRFLYHPNKDLIMNKTVYDVNNPNLVKMFEEVKKGHSGKVEYTEDGVKKIATYSPTESGWGIFTVTPVSEINAPVISLFKTLLTISAIILVIGLIITYAIGSSITKPITKLNSFVSRVAKGELHHEVEISGKDEIASLSQNFNVTVANLRKMVEQLNESAHLVKTTTNTLNNSAVNTEKVSNLITNEVGTISYTTNEQLKGVHMMVNMINNLTAEIQTVAANSEEVAASSQESSAMSQKGKEVVDSAVEKINYLSKIVTHTADVIGKLDNKTSQINEITHAISEISDKTNLLALNAAIEASRAGEAGKGFSVVADEVRKLAEQTNTAAGKISVMVEEIQIETQNAVKEVTDGVLKVKEGIVAVKDAGVTFDEINTAVESVAEQISGVSQVVENMSVRSVEIMSSLTPFIRISEDSSKSATEIANGVRQTDEDIHQIVEVAHNLSETSKKLEEMISKFKTK